MSLYPDAASLNSPPLRRFPGMVRKRVGQDWLMRFMPFKKVYDRMPDRFQFGIPFVFKGGIAISRDFAAFAFYQDRITELILNCNYHGHHPLPGLMKFHIFYREKCQRYILDLLLVYFDSTAHYIFYEPAAFVKFFLLHHELAKYFRLARYDPQYLVSGRYRIRCCLKP